MQKNTYKIINRRGLHARASAVFVKAATPFSSEIKLIFEGIQANGKSIMGIMMLAAAKGSIVELTTDGPDEIVAMQVIGDLIKSGFGEY